MSNLAVNMPWDELSDETNYRTVRDCIIKRADGKFEMIGPLKEIMEKRIAASDRGEFSSRSFWQIVNETLAEKP